jgi:hypothetical protein
MIKPTIGRKVWYWPELTEQVTVISRTQPLDATVVYVHNDREINLVVFDHQGQQWFKGNVHLIQPSDTDYIDAPHASWMPYQVGQATKATP